MNALDTSTMRLHYIDWRRVLAVLLLFPFHVTRIFNSEAFCVKPPGSRPPSTTSSPSSPSGTRECSSCWPAPPRTARSASAAPVGTSASGAPGSVPPSSWLCSSCRSRYRLFVLGFVAVRAPEFMQSAERYHRPALALGLALSAWWVLSRDLRDALPDPSLQLEGLNLLGTLATWLVVVGLLGWGRWYLNRQSATLAYLAEGSYPVYLLHQTVIAVAAYYVVGQPAAGPLQWLTLLVMSVAVTFALYEAVRRSPAARLLFGMRSLEKGVRRESRVAQRAAVS
ncbi:MAG: glucans biosynthesis protein [Actinobacteria bacterium ADurb.BinA094]|nr:MAG: glucans biosynthesis protein [Actinobacteria bacterium ADurb.BinA094]